MLILRERHLAFRLSVQHIQCVLLSQLISIIRTFQKLYALIFLFVLLIICNASAMANNGTFKLTTGAEYITGNFGGSESVDQLYIPLTGVYSTNKYAFRLTIPYIYLTGPVGTVQSDGTIITGTGSIITELGIGDVIAGATYRDVFNTESILDLAFDFTAKVKFGTADEDEGLGSGENDYTLQAEVYNFRERSMLFGILGYKFRGDPPGDNYDNSLLALIGGSYNLTPELRTGLDFYYQHALFSGVDEQMELSAFLRYKISNTQSLRSYLVKGLSDASPDWGIGVYVTFMQ